MTKMFRSLVFVLFLAPALSGCQTPLLEKGNMLPPEAVNRIQVGHTTRSEVKELLGSPTLVNMFRKERWLYIQDRRIKDQRVVNRLEIIFDRNGIVANMRKNFEGQLLEPDEESVAIATVETRTGKNNWWTRFWSKDDILSPSVESTGGAVSPPVPAPVVRADQNQEEESFWSRYFTSGSKKKAPPPDLTLSEKDQGWWKSIWPDNPVRDTPPASPQ